MTFHSALIDGQHRGERFEHEGDDPAAGDEFVVEGVTYRFTGTQGIDMELEPDVVRWHATADSLELFKWFNSLRPEVKTRLAADAFAAVPTDLIPEVAHSGQHLVGTYWVDSEPGPDGFYLPVAAQEWIHEHFRPTDSTDPDNPVLLPR